MVDSDIRGLSPRRLFTSVRRRLRGENHINCSRRRWQELKKSSEKKIERLEGVKHSFYLTRIQSKRYSDINKLHSSFRLSLVTSSRPIDVWLRQSAANKWRGIILRQKQEALSICLTGDARMPPQWRIAHRRGLPQILPGFTPVFHLSERRAYC